MLKLKIFSVDKFGFTSEWHWASEWLESSDRKIATGSHLDIGGEIYPVKNIVCDFNLGLVKVMLGEVHND